MTPPESKLIWMASIGALGLLLLVTLIFQLITLAVVVLRTKTKKFTVIKDEVPASYVSVFNNEIGHPKVPGVPPFLEVQLNRTSEV